MKRMFTCLLVLSILVSSVMVSSAQEIELQSAQKIEDVVQIKKVASIEEGFDPRYVIVTMKNQHSVINKSWKLSEFLPVEISEIFDLRPIPISRAKEYGSRTKFRTILRLTLTHPSKQNVLDAIELLQKREDVYAVEPDYYCAVSDSTTPNDPMYSTQTALDAIQVDRVWDFTTGSSDVTVAVFDSQVYSHPDLVDNLISGYDYNDGVTNTSNTHGTSVASVIGAKGNNDRDVCGVCWDISIKPFELGSNLSLIIAAFNQADLDNIPIINLSKRYGLNEAGVTSLREAIDDYRGLLVCSAGNENSDVSNLDYYPPKYDLDNILVVGACYETGSKYTTSNYGDAEVDVFAPYQSTVVGHDTTHCYSFFETSAATPLVTGVAALLKSYNPTLTTAQLKAAILDGAAPKSALEDLCVSGGMLDAYGALLQVTGKLKNYYTEVRVSANSELTNLACSITYNTGKLANTRAELGMANNLPLDIEPGKVAFIRSPSTPTLIAGGVLFKAEFSMPASYTLNSSDLVLNKINPSNTSSIWLSRYLLGDVDGDGTIDSGDSLMVLQYTNNQTTLSASQKIRADVNLDGSVGVVDTALINQYLVNTILTFR